MADRPRPQLAEVDVFRLIGVHSRIVASGMDRPTRHRMKQAIQEIHNDHHHFPSFHTSPRLSRLRSALRLRQSMTAVRLSCTWLGVRKTLTPPTEGSGG